MVMPVSWPRSWSGTMIVRSSSSWRRRRRRKWRTKEVIIISVVKELRLSLVPLILLI